MDKGLKIAGLVVLGVALVGGAAYAGARVAQAQVPNTPAGVVGPGMMYSYPGGSTVRGGAGLMAEYHSQMLSSLAGSLGMSVDDLTRELQSGKTLAQIAEEKNVSTDKLQEAILKAESDALAQAVKDGRLTQEQADQMLALMKQNPNLGFGYGFGMGSGMMNNFRGRGRNFDNDGRPGFGPGMRGPRFWQGQPGQPGQPQATPTPNGTSS